MDFIVPPLLTRTVDLEPSPGRRAWLARLPHAVEELAARWDLDVGRPFEPGGQTAWVAPVRDRAGRELVLKVAWVHHEAEQEPEGLRAWCGRGAVTIYDWYRHGDSMGLLLERCDPGTPLGAVSPEAEQDRVVAGLLRRLWQAPTAGFAFRPLEVMCQAWVTGFRRRVAAGGVVDPGLARAGTELFLGLSAGSGRDVLLCTDLHAGNVLAARREPWLVIDPKPFVGDPCYDVLQHLLNCRERLLADPPGLAQRMADLVDVDGDRVRQWLFARCVIEGVDDPVLQAVAAELAPLT